MAEADGVVLGSGVAADGGVVVGPSERGVGEASGAADSEGDASGDVADASGGGGGGGV